MMYVTSSVYVLWFACYFPFKDSVVDTSLSLSALQIQSLYRLGTTGHTVFSVQSTLSELGVPVRVQ